MRFKLTIILLLLNITLISFIYYIDKSANTEKFFTEEGNLVFQPGIVENCDSLIIENKQEQLTWKLVRNNNDWQIEKPVEWPANIFAVRRIINQLTFLEKVTEFDVDDIKKSGQSLSDYGLSEPNAVISLINNNIKTTIKIGETTEIGRRLYVLSPDESRILVINRDILDSISIGLEELKSQKIFDIPLFEIQSLNIQLYKPDSVTVQLSKNENGWSFESPIQTEADTSSVIATINSLTSLNVDSFIKADYDLQGLTNPSMRLTIQGDNRKLTVKLGNLISENKRQKKYYGMLENNPTVFILSAQPFEVLKEAQVNLRDKTFIKCNWDELTSIDIEVSDKMITLQKLETGIWNVLEKIDKGELIVWEADSNLVQGIINAFTKLEVLKFITDAPAENDLEKYGIKSPHRKITIHADKDLEVLIGDMDFKNKLRYVKLNSEPYIYQIKPFLLHMLKLNALHYRQRTLNEQPTSAKVQKLTIKELNKGITILAQDFDVESDNLISTLSDLDDKKRNAVVELLNSIKTFEVKEYLRYQFDEEFKLDKKTNLPWKYRFDAVILLPSGNGKEIVNKTYFFTDRVGGTTQYGGSPDDDLTFTLTQKLIDALFTVTFTPESIIPDKKNKE